jgi:hypothetical protein
MEGIFFISVGGIGLRTGVFCRKHNQWTRASKFDIRLVNAFHLQVGWLGMSLISQ